MIQEGEVDVGAAFTSHICGLLFGAATITSLVPAVAKLMRLLAE
jgi:hypothetical protein